MNFSSKKDAMRNMSDGQILVCKNLNRFCLLSGYEELGAILLNNVGKKQFLYEYIFESKPVNFFYDIEIYDEERYDVINNILERTTCFFKGLGLDVCQIVLESHKADVKRSYHVVYQLKEMGRSIQLASVHVAAAIAKHLHLELTKEKIIDCSVYREGCFRTIYSSKRNENRPLVKSDLSDAIEICDTFVQCCKFGRVVWGLDKFLSASNSDFVTAPSPIISAPSLIASAPEMEVLKSFVQRIYRIEPSTVKLESDRVIIGTREKHCSFILKHHNGNNQYVILDLAGSRQKCHDTDCKTKTHFPIDFSNFPHNIKSILSRLIAVGVGPLVNETEQEATDYVLECIDPGIQTMTFDADRKLFYSPVSDKSYYKIQDGKCEFCQGEHRIEGSKYCVTCIMCNSSFPKKVKQMVPSDYSKLISFSSSYNQLVNTGTINITNNYGENDFSCDISIDEACGLGELTSMYNQILDGHKVVKISELLNKSVSTFSYAEENWYYFDGSVWDRDVEGMQIRGAIIKLASNFERIKTFFEAKDKTNPILKNIKALITKMYRPGFEDEIVKGAKMYFHNKEFTDLLNSKKHLVPFKNGVFDLLKREFRQTEKDDYINLTVNFDFEECVDNPEVHKFIREILPDTDVRDYVLKKFAECLNGDIPNTNFLMFIGNGANGKSQILNLMKACMGQLGEKMEVTLLTRKRNNANEANPEKIKLLNKRFAFLSEPEDKEKINIGLLKELTGSEEIVARGLYEGSKTFVMETKLFLACNELPDIKGEDTAIWRRIRVVDFPSRFVDEPKGPNDFKIDKELPSKLRTVVSWRQTFMNIILDYYYRQVLEPEVVKVSTRRYKSENNEVERWLTEHIQQKASAFLTLADVCTAVGGDNMHHSTKRTKVKEMVELFLTEKFHESKCYMQEKKVNGKTSRGWMGYVIIDIFYY